MACGVRKGRVPLGDCLWLARGPTYCPMASIQPVAVPPRAFRRVQSPAIWRWFWARSRRGWILSRAPVPLGTVPASWGGLGRFRGVGGFSRGLQSPWGLPLAGTWANVLSNGANPVSGCTPRTFRRVQSPASWGWCWALSRLGWFLSRAPVPLGLPLAGTWANVLSNGANPAGGCTPRAPGRMGLYGAGNGAIMDAGRGERGG